MDADLRTVVARLTGLQTALDQMISMETFRPRHMQLVRLRGEVAGALDAVTDVETHHLVSPGAHEAA